MGRVDAHLLTFSALVLAAGSLSDRFGRKGAPLIGLAIFGAGAAIGGMANIQMAIDITGLASIRRRSPP